ncbi:glycoside hydrolase family 16 protein [Vibrio sp. SM6]|uniref:Glycoside hydrolase family 16 protein n=1 Tax=Vibrio agarilyticus TaxID=2726741 RepID=A0A7X8TTK6_9VIBR|nr:glycoside hydrolase family 16 protein [Vibrio agarilyticus]
MLDTKFAKLPLAALCSSAILMGCGGSDSSPSKPTPEEPKPNEKGWVMVWNDEFSGTEIDTTKWGWEENCWGGGNGEQQCYTDRAKNSFVQDGMLNIVAIQESFTGPNNPDGNPGTVTLPYTSARLRTMNLGDWTYGRFEIRAKLPSGQGTWPAIWMLPTDYVYGGWAASGEIDIMEAVNLGAASDDTDTPGMAGQPERRIHGTLHYGAAWPNNTSSGAEYYLPNGVNPAEGFHTYAVEWEKDEIRWYADDVHYATQRSSGWYSHYQENGQWVTGQADAPFNQDFHILLNLAVGGSWAGNTNEKGIDPNIFPQTMLVDFVRVYECAADPQTGHGCATISPDAEFVQGRPAP